MTAYLVRHAKAGDRADWDGDDRLRPLSKPGNRQAEALVQILEGLSVDAVLSSPYLRCIQTVEPLADQRGLTVKPEADLAEGAGADGALRTMQRYPGQQVVLCSHGDVIEELLERLIAEGVVPRSGARLEKGSTWILKGDAPRIKTARYLPAP